MYYLFLGRETLDMKEIRRQRKSQPAKQTNKISKKKKRPFLFETFVLRIPQRNRKITRPL